MALQLPSRFKKDIQGKDTNIFPVVIIGNRGGIDQPSILDWLNEGSIHLSTKNFSHSSSYSMGSYVSNAKPLLLNIPSLKESIDLEKRKYKISSLTLNLTNLKHDGKRFSELVSEGGFGSLINTEIRIFWFSPSVTKLYPFDGTQADISSYNEYAAQTYFGTIRRYEHDDEKATLTVEDRSQATLHKDLPETILTQEGVPEKFKNKRVPMVYGKVDKSPCVINENQEIQIDTKPIESLHYETLDWLSQEYSGSPLFITEEEVYIAVSKHIQIDTGATEELLEQSTTDSGDSPENSVADIFGEQWFHTGESNTIQFNNLFLWINNFIHAQLSYKPTSLSFVSVQDDYETNLIDGDAYNKITDGNDMNWWSFNLESVIEHDGSGDWCLEEYNCHQAENDAQYGFESMISHFKLNIPTNFTGMSDNKKIVRVTLNGYNLPVAGESGVKASGWYDSRVSVYPSNEPDEDVQPGSNEYLHTLGIPEFMFLFTFPNWSDWDSEDLGGIDGGLDWWDFDDNNPPIAEAPNVCDIRIYGNHEQAPITFNNGGNVPFDKRVEALYFYDYAGIGTDNKDNDIYGIHFRNHLQLIRPYDDDGSVYDLVNDYNFWFRNILKIDGKIKDINIYAAADYDKAKSRNFYVNVTGRIGDIPQADEIIEDILLSLNPSLEIKSIDGSYSDMFKYQFTVNEKINSKKLIENIGSASSFIPHFNNMGVFKFDEIPLNGGVSQHTVKEKDVIDFSYSRTKIEDVKTKVELFYHYDYARNEFDKSVGTEESIDIHKIYSNYKMDYYGFKEDELGNEHAESTLVVDDDRGKYIREGSHNTASKLAYWLLSWYCNQHLKIKAKLPLSYMEIEVGDIIDFDRLLSDVAPYGIRYNKNSPSEDRIINGQQAFSQFIVTSTNKRLDFMELECMQLHAIQIDECLEGIMDCHGVCGGDWEVDECGVCNGNGEPCVECPDQLSPDCNGVCGGDAELDCEGICEGTAEIDDCGICGGNNQIMDDCGECNGNNELKDCAGVCNGDAYIDNCGVCVEGTTGLDDCLHDCAGVENGTSDLDSCGVCMPEGENTDPALCCMNLFLTADTEQIRYGIFTFNRPVKRTENGSLFTDYDYGDLEFKFSNDDKTIEVYGFMNTYIINQSILRLFFVNNDATAFDFMSDTPSDELVLEEAIFYTGGSSNSWINWQENGVPNTAEKVFTEIEMAHENYQGVLIRKASIEDIDYCPPLGDTNNDGAFNILDIVILANCVLAGNCEDNHIKNCTTDINGDGDRNILDIVQLVNCVLAGSCGELQ